MGSLASSPANSMTPLAAPTSKAVLTLVAKKSDSNIRFGLLYQISEKYIYFLQTFRKC
jgi:hypothetical protein